jgi:hypothetical protein
MKKRLLILLLSAIFIFSAESQEGIQIGFGAGTLLMDYTKDFNGIHKRTLFFNPRLTGYEDSGITGSNPYFVELNLNYAFNDRIQIKSGVQYRARKLEQFNSWELTTSVFSFPLILNYKLPLSNKHKLSFGLNLGLSLDRYMSFKGGYTTVEERFGNSGKYTKLYPDFYNGKIHYLNGSWRYGINLEKEFENNGRLSLHVIYSYLHQGNRVHYNYDLVENTYIETNSGTKKATSITNIYSHNAGESGLLIGLNYYFGQLVFNKK